MLSDDFEIDDLDSENWISKIEQLDSDLDCYYKEDVNTISIHFLYLNADNEIQKLTKQTHILKIPNLLTKDEFMGLITSNANSHQFFMSLRYNMSLEPMYLENFIRHKDIVSMYEFLSPIDTIDDVFFSPTISIFQDLNDIYIIYMPKSQGSRQNRATTKKHRLVRHKKTIKAKTT